MSRKNGSLIPTLLKVDRVESGQSMGDMPDRPYNLTKDQKRGLIAIYEERSAAYQACDAAEARTEAAKSELRAATAKAYDVSLQAREFDLEAEQERQDTAATGSE
jgi:shikimate kinase